MHDKNLSTIATVCVKGDTYTQHMSPITQINNNRDQQSPTIRHQSPNNLPTICVKRDTYTQQTSPITQRNRAEEQNDARN